MISEEGNSLYREAKLDEAGTLDAWLIETMETEDLQNNDNTKRIAHLQNMTIRQIYHFQPV